MLKRRIDWAALALGLIMIGLIFVVFEAGPERQVTAVREAVFDEYQRLQPRPYNPESPVRVVDIDETSLKQLGQWPWPRTFLAEMVYRLTNAGAAVIAFDMIFSEPDRTSPEILVPSLQRFGDDYSAVFQDPSTKRGTSAVPDHDASFGWLISQAPVVLGMIAEEGATSATMPEALRQPSQLGGDRRDLFGVIDTYDGVVTNLPVLSQGASGIAAFNLAATEGSIIRRVPMVIMIDDPAVPNTDEIVLAAQDLKLLPTLSMEALRVAQAEERSNQIKTSRGSGEDDYSGGLSIASIRTGNVIVPVDRDGALRVRYSGAEDRRVIPAHRVLEAGGIPDDVAADVAGKIIFVGTSVTGLFDLVRTPLSNRVAGVHVHAEVTEQILDGAYLVNPDWALGLERLIVVVLGLVVILLLALNFPLSGFIAMVLSVLAVVAGSWFAFSEYSILFNPLLPALGIGIPHLTVSGYKFFTAEASRREVTRQFEHFVAPEVIADIIDNPERHLTPGGDQRVLSIMFLDVRRFSTITEKMQPQEVIAFINKLLTPLTDAIIENEGTIDKYMGDAVMAFWNAPRMTERHEIKAIRAMLAFNPIMEELNADFTAEGLPDIDIGVGINTGECSVGNMGSLKRLAYSCVGDSVNLAARLEGQTKAYGVRNLIGSATAATAMEEFACIELDAVAVKGRTQPETIFTVAGDANVLRSTAFEDLRHRLRAARQHYLSQEWDAAEAAFHQAADLGIVGVFDPRPLAGIMIERIMGYRIDPPPDDWDGVYVATSK
ncbi:MAG: adenylate/guanylate cyclase domain-containing protein [Pseudomonadota bacterium]